MVKPFFVIKWRLNQGKVSQVKSSGTELNDNLFLQWAAIENDKPVYIPHHLIRFAISQCQTEHVGTCKCEKKEK